MARVVGTVHSMKLNSPRRIHQPCAKLFLSSCTRIFFYKIVNRREVFWFSGQHNNSSAVLLYGQLRRGDHRGAKRSTSSRHPAVPLGFVAFRCGLLPAGALQSQRSFSHKHRKHPIRPNHPISQQPPSCCFDKGQPLLRSERNEYCT
jgi:hypothetical protein